MLIYKAFKCTSVPSWGGVRSGAFSRSGDSFHDLQGHIIPILCGTVKGVLRRAGVNPCNYALIK